MTNDLKQTNFVAALVHDELCVSGVRQMRALKGDVDVIATINEPDDGTLFGLALAMLIGAAIDELPQGSWPLGLQALNSWLIEAHGYALVKAIDQPSAGNA